MVKGINALASALHLLVRLFSWPLLLVVPLGGAFTGWITAKFFLSDEVVVLGAEISEPIVRYTLLAVSLLLIGVASFGLLRLFARAWRYLWIESGTLAKMGSYRIKREARKRSAKQLKGRIRDM